MKPGSSCCRLSSKTPEEDEEDKQEAIAGPAAAKEISPDAAVAAFLSEPDGILTFKEEQSAVLIFSVDNIISP